MAKLFINLICAGFLDVNTASTIKHLSACLISIPGDSNTTPIPGNQFYVIIFSHYLNWNSFTITKPSFNQIEISLIMVICTIYY